MIAGTDLRYKKRMSGDEDDLVFNFLSIYKEDLNSNYNSVTILTEPFTGSGFPDIVVVIWDEEKMQNWNPERNNLFNIDLKILHHMTINNIPYTHEVLKEQLGYSIKQINKSIEMLTNAKLIKHCKNKTFKVCSEKETFFVKSIIAIEAKIKDWKNAFRQAETNFWFASESYVLLPDHAVSNNVIEKATESSVGLLSFDGYNYYELSKSDKIKMPVSYCSWIFNENIGRNPDVRSGIKNGSI